MTMNKPGNQRFFFHRPRCSGRLVDTGTSPDHDYRHYDNIMIIVMIMTIIMMIIAIIMMILEIIMMIMAIIKMIVTVIMTIVKIIMTIITIIS